MTANLLMNPAKLRFYIERYEKEKKYITLRKTFVPTTRTKALTRKFYAKHDVISPLDVREEDIKLIKLKIDATPKDIYTFKPPTVNMEYGWFSTPLIPLSKDRRLRFPYKQSDFIKKEIELRKLYAGLPQTKFTGVPFRT